MAAENGDAYIKYTATLVYEHARAQELFDLDAANMRYQICKSFDRLRLPHPSVHNLGAPDTSKDSIEMCWYTESINTMTSSMVENAFNTLYETADYVKLRRNLGIREMRVHHGEVSESQLPKKDRSRLKTKVAGGAQLASPQVKVKPSNIGSSSRNVKQEQTPSQLPPARLPVRSLAGPTPSSAQPTRSLALPARPPILPIEKRGCLRYTATIFYERDRATRPAQKSALDNYADLCRDLDALQLPHPTLRDVQMSDIDRGSVTFCWYTQDAYSKLALAINTAFHTVYHSAKSVDLRKSLGIYEMRVCPHFANDNEVPLYQNLAGAHKESPPAASLPARPAVDIADGPASMAKTRTKTSVPDRDAASIAPDRNADQPLPERNTTLAAPDRNEALSVTQRKIAAMRADSRMHTSRGDCYISLRLSYILHDTYGIFQRFSNEELRRYIHVELDGSGGHAKFGYWLHELQRGIVRPELGVFARASPGNATLELAPVGDSPDANSLSGAAGSSSDAESSSQSGAHLHLDYIRFAGRCAGLIVFYKRLLDAPLPPVFFKLLVKRRPELQDLKAVDVELYRSLCWVLENNITDVLFETFSIEEETSTGLRVVELIPGGAQIPVTEANKKEYVDARVGHRLIGRVRRELDAFRDGFTGFVPIDLLRRFTEDELAVLSCGLPEITISGWQRRTQIRGYAPDDPVVAWFWDCVRGWDVARLEKLLFFVTGKTRVPLGSPHERSRLPRAPDAFNIERGGNPGALPTSHACSSTLYLPPYPSRRVLEKKLLNAIEESQEVLEERAVTAHDGTSERSAPRCELTSDMRQELMRRLLTDATFDSGITEHETRPLQGPQCATETGDGRKRARTTSYDGSPRKRLRLDNTADSDSHALTDILEEELAQLKEHLQELREYETALFMQLTTATLPTSAPTQQSVSSSLSPAPSAGEESRLPRSPHETASLELNARERELNLERAVRLATEQTLEDVQREIKSPHVLYMLMGALECL